jgi:hypothetical protein
LLYHVFCALHIAAALFYIRQLTALYCMIYMMLAFGVFELGALNRRHGYTLADTPRYGLLNRGRGFWIVMIVIYCVILTVVTVVNSPLVDGVAAVIFLILAGMWTWFAAFSW